MNLDEIGFAAAGETTYAIIMFFAGLAMLGTILYTGYSLYRSRKERKWLKDNQ